MPVHDAYARVTPYELTLPDEGYAEKRFPLIREEARSRGLDITAPEGFVMVAEVGAALREIRSPQDDPALIQEYGALLFHAFHFWEAGKPFFLLDGSVVRHLTEPELDMGDWQARVPGPAGYVQLPQHLLWARSSEELPPESLDGFFWTSTGGEQVTVLAAMGMRGDRPGLSIIPLPTLPLIAVGEWAHMHVRDSGEDFSSNLPGSELEGLYSIEAAGELVKLVGRFLWYLDSFPGTVTGGEPGTADGVGPEPSVLEYRRVIREGID